MELKEQNVITQGRGRSFLESFMELKDISNTISPHSWITCRILHGVERMLINLSTNLIMI
ncbi:hypothetical protein Mcup_1080 [Metallosphaera cuprina Ar-4]|uniref:Uncharacterized protein n=1 Tax=Metallosphaera cuprina (strain Ar-4) TaxID=1006006 RepID=F4G2Y7_METCR|nr:hypothetical protein Mcup_1080 [Metallosphaera cuprina Ar-4]